MTIYLAPMEGLTGFIVRNAFFHHFEGIDQYYTPFISAAENMNQKIIRDITPSNNEGLSVIPQLMSNQADQVIYMQRQLQKYGYHEVNINLGCPSGTVSSKKRGSGLLGYPKELDAFLNGVYEKADFPVSIKTRIGYESVDLWPQILSIYKKYPISELMIHPRIRSDFYKGLPRLKAFDDAVEMLCDSSITLCYNGDIWNKNDYDILQARYPKVSHFMIGRGLLANPALAEQIKGIENGNYKERFLAFHDEVYAGYAAIFSGEKDAMMHMKEIWFYLGKSFADSEKHVKKILKSQNPTEYKLSVRKIFEECELCI